VLPSEVVLLGGGFLASQGKVSVIVAGLLATGATLAGNSLLFQISRRYGRAALDRYGKYVHLRPDRVDRIESWIGRSGTPILIYGPLVPLLRAYVPALAGLFGVPYRYYIVLLLGAALVWSYGLLALGQVMGDHWFDAVMFLRNNVLVGAVVVAAILALALLFLRRRRRVALERAQHWPESVLEPPPARGLVTVRLRGHTTKLHPKEE
jgi:membrane protein DedA with SNARE-associated domain